MRSVCNHCEQDHHLERVSSSGSSGQLEQCKVGTSGAQRSTGKRSASGCSEARKRLNSAQCVTVSDQEEEEEEERKCIICRSDCKDINECQRAAAAIRGPCEGGRAAECGDQRQGAVDSVPGTRNTRWSAEMATRRRRRRGEESGEHRSFGWAGGGATDSAEGVSEEEAMDRGGGGGGGSHGDPKRASKRISLRGSMFVLLVALFLSSTATLSPWNVGEMLMGHGALVVDGKEQLVADLVTDPEPGVCQSIDVRNKPEYLEKLKRCRVIEGFLRIVLMESDVANNFDNMTFPLLTEITEFLLIYRIKSLRSLGQLFPNLAVIRGHDLFTNYALVVYEVFDLEEVGLTKLKYIGRGAVRMEKNPKLCFADSIDWSLLMNATTHETNFFNNNRMENECPVCPGGGNGTADCPMLPYVPGPTKRKDRYACWNSKSCQVKCDKQCPQNCDDLGNCCSPNCIGGCSRGNPTNCTACRQYSLYSNSERRCVNECPNPLVRHMGRRCITHAECLRVKKPLDQDFLMSAKPYLPFEGECRTNCPDHHQLNEQLKTCVDCRKAGCKKNCQGAKIDSIAAAQKMKGCQVIRGTLEIQVRREGGASVVDELERFLFMIEEIHGQLKISRSDPLVSLQFLKNLRLIKGVIGDKIREPHEPVFTLTENENLQDLFAENQVVRIENGNLNFHTNPKLCVNRIQRLEKMVAGNTKFDLESFRSSNGDRVACNLTKMYPYITMLNSQYAKVEFDSFPVDDERSLLGYVIYYKPAPHRNVTMFDGRDACGFDGWVNDDISVKKDPEKPSALLTLLEPNTQYAYYVKTVQLASVHMGGESDIHYFRTDPDQPTVVRNARVKSIEANSIVVAWDPPEKANGNLTKYIITAKWLKDSEEIREQRNYCQRPFEQLHDNPSLPPTPAPETPKVSPNDARCECQKDTKLTSEETAENTIQFENEIHNYVYIKRRDPIPDKALDDHGGSRRRRRRSSDQYVNDFVQGNSSMPPDYFPIKDSKETKKPEPVKILKENVLDAQGRYEYFYKEVDVPNTTLEITNLRHFASYALTFVACHPAGEVNKNCSEVVIVYVRTDPLVEADNIDKFEIKGSDKNSSHNVVTLKWEPPVEPNGMVLVYTIQFKNTDVESALPSKVCVQATEFEAQNKEYRLKLGSENGNYSIEVQVTSLSGPGRFSAPLFHDVKNPSYTLWYVLLALMCILLLLVPLIYYFYLNKKREKDHRLFAEVNPDYDATPYIPDEYEIPRERVKRLQEMGQGSFGMVYAGTVQLKDDDPTETECAIKTVNESATERERRNFLKEAHVMKEFNTPHVVKLLGVVSTGDPPLVIMELMAMGDLKGYLRAHRPDADPGPDGDIPVPPSVRQILQMAIEIADGMAYLSYKKFVHRDLAARNCMVAGDLTVKIGDFGMTRDIYETDYYRKGDKGLLPVRWMSPESLKDGIFTTSNDVFSYGVVLWEMATLASQPYQGLSNDQVLRYVIDGGVMERPENCPEKIYQLMRKCWAHRPTSRPTFLDIVQMLLEDTNAKFYRNSFYFSEEGEAHRFMLQNDGHHPDEGTTLLRPENEMSHENARENWDMPNNNNNSRRLLEEGGAMPIIKPAHSPLRFLTGKSGNDYKESKF